MDQIPSDNQTSSDQAVSESIDTTALLARLSRPLDFDEFGFHWLALQCQMLGNVTAAVLLSRETGSNSFKPLAKYPLDARVDALAEVAYGVIEEECGLLVALDSGSTDPSSGQTNRYAAAYPVHVDEELQAIVALEVNVSDAGELQTVMGQLQWSVGWITLYYSGQKIADLTAESFRSTQALAIFSQVQSQTESEAANQTLVTALATELGCDRVSIGFPASYSAANCSVRVDAISHTVQFGKQMGLLTAISNAMSEALTLGRDIVLPLKDSSVSAPDHGHLMNEYSSQSIASLPIFVADRFRCVLTLEKSTGAKIDTDTLEFVRAIGVLCSPTLEDRRIAQRSLLQVVRDKSRQQLERLFGSGYIGRKILLAASVLLLLFFSFATGTYRIAAETELQGVVQRVMAAPFNGYIANASVRAGDIVKAGDVVAQLEDEELRLERQKWLSERSQYRHEYNEAFAKVERSVVNINKAKMDQATAELALTEQKLLRSQIAAPFDGLIISGDLSQRLGGFVEQGEVLFEIAPLDNYRVVLFVEDNRIGDVAVGQHGNLVLSSLSSHTFPFVVTVMTPMTEARDGGNFFRVEASLLEGSPILRPGMQGIGKIEVDERRLINIWTRSFREWLQLQLWKWLP
ncbi:MAG: HlyD family efflux transporter periplasmic adaptor subunit [Oceanicoccus sp.]